MYFCYFHSSGRQPAIRDNLTVEFARDVLSNPKRKGDRDIATLLCQTSPRVPVDANVVTIV